MQNHAEKVFDSLIVIVTYNSEKDVENCIRSVDKYFPSVHTGQAAVCVVDNASSDKTPSILERLNAEFDWLNIFRQPENLGFGRANNVAFSKIKSNAYFLLNADAYLVADSLTPALELMKSKPEIGVMGLPLVFPDGRPQSFSYVFSSWHRWLLFLIGARNVAILFLRNRCISKFLTAIPYGQNFVRTHARPPLDTNNAAALQEVATLELQSADWVSGAAMLLSHDFVRASGGFDPNIFLYGEDEDLCIQAHNNGFDVVTLSTIPVVHVLGWGGNSFRPKVARMKYDSLRYFIKKNIKGRFSRVLMRALLPFYVYGKHAPKMIFGRSEEVKDNA